MRNDEGREMQADRLERTGERQGAERGIRGGGGVGGYPTRFYKV